MTRFNLADIEKFIKSIPHAHDRINFVPFFREKGAV